MPKVNFWVQEDDYKEFVRLFPKKYGRGGPRMQLIKEAIAAKKASTKMEFAPQQETDGRVWVELPLKLADYQHSTVFPLPDYHEQTLADFDEDEYVDRVLKTVKMKLGESRISLQVTKKEKNL